MNLGPWFLWDSTPPYRRISGALEQFWNGFRFFLSYSKDCDQDTGTGEGVRCDTLPCYNPAAFREAFLHAG